MRTLAASLCLVVLGPLAACTATIQGSGDGAGLTGDGGAAQEGGHGSGSGGSGGSSGGGGSSGASSSGGASSGGSSSGGTDAGGAVDASPDAGGGAACTADLQKDAKNCGACGHDCLGATCSAGMCTPEGVGDNGNLTNLSTSFALDSTNLYVAGQTVSGSKAANVVAALPLAGGAPVILSQTTTGAWTGDRVVVADGRLFWSDQERSAVFSVALTAKAAAATSVYDDGQGSIPVAGLAATKTTLYWLEACSGLYSATLPTGKYTTVANYDCNTVDMNQAVLDPAGKYMYYSDTADGEILQINVANGDQAIVASNVGYAVAVAADSKYVYWTDGGTCNGTDTSASCTGGKVMRALPSGASPTTLVDGIDSTGAWGGLAALAVDADAVYYTVYQGATSTLYERKLAGGKPFALATIAYSIVPSGSYVYYSVGGGGVARVAK